MKKIAIVTGGTSGIGLATARALTAGGYIVYTFSRRGGQARDLSVDVTDEAAVASAVGQVVAAEGRLDLVVNCAGFGISGAVEFTETADAMRLFDVNFFGMVRVNRAALPHLRATGGRILNVSSGGHSVPGLLFLHQGGHQRLLSGAGQRSEALRHLGHSRHARGHRHGLHRRPGEIRRRG